MKRAPIEDMLVESKGGKIPWQKIVYLRRNVLPALGFSQQPSPDFDTSDQGLEKVFEVFFGVKVLKLLREQSHEARCG
jgi:hypothetical protein